MREEAERTLAKVEELWAVSAENERLKKELAEAKESEQRHEAEARESEQRHEAETKILQNTIEAIDAASASHEARVTTAERAASTAKIEVTKLNNMFASFNRHTIGLSSHQSQAVKPWTHDLPLAAIHTKRAQHYHKQASASFRSASPRFGKSHQLAARGVAAGGNVALGEEQPSLPCPGSNHSNRDSKGTFWSMSCQAHAQFDLPSSLAPPAALTDELPVRP